MKTSVFASDKSMRGNLRRLRDRPETGRDTVDVYQNRKTGKIEYAAFGFTGYDVVRKGTMRLSYRIRIKVGGHQ
jgi:hypothetical protein